MKNAGVIAFASFLALIAAVPFNKQDVVLETVIKEVIIEVVETVHFTTTIWVPPGGAETSATPASITYSSADQQTPVDSPSSSSVLSTTPSSLASSFDAVNEGYKASIILESSSPVSSITSPLPAYTSPIYGPVANTPSTNRAPSTTSVYSPPAQTYSSTSSVDEVANQCTDEAPCSGDMTYYTAGLGACGFTDDGDTGDIVALSVGMLIITLPSGPSLNRHRHDGRPEQ
ncbi:hypothetical protein MMC12_001761 [Toensbergia leucococca]|nr:hypothetical protein [Toensbergia leucococca]